MNIDPSIFKAYDIRGLYPGELNEETAYAIGRGFAAYLKAATVAVSRDMRLSSPSLSAAFIDGVRTQGTNVIDYGMLGTDQLYFAVVNDGLEGGAQITASHNPKHYNGVKMVKAEALPLSGDAGIGDIRRLLPRRHAPFSAFVGRPGAPALLLRAVGFFFVVNSLALRHVWPFSSIRF